MREIERRIQKVEAYNKSGEIREIPTAPVGVPDSFDDHVKLMFDLQAIAFASDTTRVFSFKMGRDASSRVYPNSGVSTGFHPASHHGDREDRILDFAKINRYHVGMLPYFLKKLKDTPDGDSNLLDNTLVVYGSPMGDSNIHNHKRCPLFFAGKAGGALKGGLHLKAADGTPMANAMLSALQGIGVEQESFGDSSGRMDSERGAGKPPSRQRSSTDAQNSRRSALTSRIVLCRTSASQATSDFAAAEQGVRIALTAWLSAAAMPVAMPMNGDRDGVKALLKKGLDVNEAQGDGTTALHWAAIKGDAELAQMLIFAGANVRATTRIGAYTPLYLAAKGGHSGVVAALLAAGADAKAVTSNGTTPLMIAAAAGDTKSITSLIENGADINAKDGAKGESPLIFAAGFNRTEAVKLLLARGADHKATDQGRRSVRADRA